MEIIEENNGYEIDDVGKAPEFVLEVASRKHRAGGITLSNVTVTPTMA